MSTSLSQRARSIPGLSHLWQRLQNTPLPEPEDSIPLRVLVQAVASVGIIAVDVAAADVADSLGISLWAVPVSWVGGMWSYRQRRSRNIPVKFCIAIAMLIALAAFFVNLLSSRNDTRLALAELLIQLQVFHSFDLPRRKDLGYSVIIGLILMGVAATLSQTLFYAPLLLAFVALIIPVLILDYRSRLGLVSNTFRQIGSDLSPRRFGQVLLVTLALGLTIFAFLPRLPGYQLRTFPVSPPIEFDGQFNSGTIINPGYVREGRTAEGTANGLGTANQDGPGQVDESFYYGFNSRINQNLRGSMKPKVVLRVRSQTEGFWRVMAFDHYTGQGWEVSRNDDEQVETFSRPPWTLRFNLPWLGFPNPTREVIQTYTVVSDMPNLIPAMYQPKELYFPTRQIAIDLEGTLRSPIPLSEGLTYTVVSEVPFRDRTRLRQSPTEYSSVVRNLYLPIPEAIAPTVREKTEAILATSPNPLTDPYEKTLYLTQYLKQQYRIQPDLPFLEEGEDLVNAFLFKYEGGYPDHFSTVLTMMLRSVGIPARLVVGFAPGEFNPFTGYYVVRNTDAFAMTEVYFPKYGWYAFNPIPGRETVPPSVENAHAFALLRKFWNWVAGWLPSPVSGFISGLLEWMTEGVAWAIAFVSALFTRGWLGLLAGLGLLIGAGFVLWLGVSGWRSWRYYRWLRSLPPMEALYQQMLHWLAEQGLRKSVAQTPLEFMEQARHHQPTPQAEVVDEISHAYINWRYGGYAPNLSHLRRRFQAIQKRSLKSMLRRRSR